MHTVIDLLRLAEGFFAKQGIDSPRVDAQYLLSELLGLSRTELYMNAKRPMDEAEVTAYRELLRRRGLGEPVAYILGEREFFSLAFKVTPAVLIPRPETEQLVEAVLTEIKERGIVNPRIVDVGTGSGCIAVTLATELAAAKILATDVSESALEIAEENAARHEVRDRISFRQSDLLGVLADRPASVDVVVSNPPYIAHAERSELSVDVREHEPSVALFADEEGLALIRTLLSQARRVLTENGVVLLEFGSTQGDRVRVLAEAHFNDVEIFKDYGGHDRWVRAASPISS